MDQQLYNRAVYKYNCEVQRRKVCVISCLLFSLEDVLSNVNRRWRIRPLLCERLVHSHYATMLSEHQLSNSDLFFNFTRISSSTFEELLMLIGPSLERKVTRIDVLNVGEILAMTLRYLATWESMTRIMYDFRVGKSTVSKIILECCNILWDVLKDDVLFTPNEDGWVKIADEFQSKWQMPHYVGALDGKHVVHQAFLKSGSVNYNYKGSHSTILMAMCYANYNFTCVNIGMPGRCSDRVVFKACEMGKKIIDNDLLFPKPTAISTNSGDFPFYIVADEAFPLLPSLMRPYPGRGTSKLPLKLAIFNYRFSRARRCIENCFGILVARWRIFSKVIIASEATANGIIKATVVLHNFIKMKETAIGLHNYVTTAINGEGQSRNQRMSDTYSGLHPVGQMSSNHYNIIAKNTRIKLTGYFAGEGSVPFQYLIC
ncbi:unnamed protein product [Macrosiphum euphorbiae]|uniref:DDE Tnp4 domain-containing protein n=1 Tax=Macrosiphum euphorbiae TaxID=13131 RepID=A0AAV0Y0F6_9HEMI|nr:unnamed protein product [Macrosiphum euphorbiae]